MMKFPEGLRMAKNVIVPAAAAAVALAACSSPAKHVQVPEQRRVGIWTTNPTPFPSHRSLEKTLQCLTASGFDFTHSSTRYELRTAKGSDGDMYYASSVKLATPPHSTTEQLYTFDISPDEGYPLHATTMEDEHRLAQLGCNTLAVLRGPDTSPEAVDSILPLHVNAIMACIYDGDRITIERNSLAFKGQDGSQIC